MDIADSRHDGHSIVLTALFGWLLVSVLLSGPIVQAAEPAALAGPVVVDPVRSGVSTLGPATVAGAAAAPSAAEDGLARRLARQGAAAFRGCYLPTGTWTGRLILPVLGERQPDGSVWIEIQNSPDLDLIGRKIRLRWTTTDPRAGWFFDIRPDLRISDATKKIAAKDASYLPTRLDGWNRVSPLESLAGARPSDNVTVRLQRPVRSGNDLIIDREPVEVVGVQKALVRFVGPEVQGWRLVHHYNPTLGSFDPGRAEYIRALRFTTATGHVPRTVNAIESLPLNAQGWYLYGRRQDGFFNVEAIEPRSLFLLRPTETHQGRKAAETYLRKTHHEGLAQGLTRRVLANGADAGWFAGRSPEQILPVGARFLITHVFGYFQQAGQKRSLMERLSPVTGHFSFGQAQVVRDAFTGEPRFEVEYRQVYVQNPHGIVSSTQAWPAYMGSLRRGVMFSRPIWDTALIVPELMPYRIDGRVFDPLAEFAREAEKMMAVYRTGAGTGMSVVCSDVSCSQDSFASLFMALQAFEERLSTDAGWKKWLATAPQNDAQVVRFRGLQSLAKDLKALVTPLGISRWDWRNLRSDPIGVRRANWFQHIGRALTSARSIFPRAAEDHLLKLAIKRGYPLWALVSVQIGGYVPGLVPLEATSLLHR